MDAEHLRATPDARDPIVREPPRPRTTGETIGRYVLLGQLGAGGMGVVHAAYDPELDRKVALKLLLPGAASGAGSLGRARLLREAQALARLSHPNVVAIHDVGTHGAQVWLAMEFVAGQTLGAWARERPRTWQEILAVLLDAARGVAAAHAAGLVHRDLKPDNVMVGRDGRVRVMDFGLAHGRVAGESPALVESERGAILRGPSQERSQWREVAMLAAKSPESRVGERARMAAESSPEVGAAATMAAESSLSRMGEAATMAAKSSPEVGEAATMAVESLPSQVGEAATMAALLEGRGEVALGASDARHERVALSQRLTRAGAVQGTPAYMAPEQWRGEEADAAADQFGWSVMAWELLHGELPFSGESLPALIDAIVSGRRRPPPRQRGVPGWLRRAIERGLMPEASRRWPTMTALLAEIERGRARARLRAVALVVIGIGILGAGVVMTQRWDRAQRVAACAAAGAQIEQVWNDKTRGEVRAAFAATGVALAATAAEKIMPWLDEGAQAWQAARTEACLNTSVRAQWDDELLDRAVWCLEDRELELSSLVAEFRRAGATTVQKAVTAAAGLSPPRTCVDRLLLERQPRPPQTGREALRAARALLSQAYSLGLAGDHAQALTLTTQAREADGVQAWPPLWAAARAQEGVFLAQAGAFEEARVAAREAYFAGARSSTWGVAAEAANRLIEVEGIRLARHADGREWAEHAAMALAHAGDQAGLREAQRLILLAGVQAAAGVHAESRALSEQALAIRTAVLGSEHPDVAASLGSVAGAHQSLGAFAEAKALHERALQIREATLGGDHPDLAVGLHSLAKTHAAMGAYGEARALLARALAIREEAFGPDHADVADSLNVLANVLESLGDYAEAGRLQRRALAIHERVFGGDHPAVAVSLTNLANVHSMLYEYGEAQALLERALPIFEARFGPDHPDVARTLNNLAGMRVAAGSLAEARAAFERALAILERSLGPDHPDVALTVTNLGETLTKLGEQSEALAMLTRSLALQERALGGDHPDVGTTLVSLSRLYNAAGRPAEARATLERALAIFERALGAEHPEVGNTANDLGALYQHAGDYARAEPLYERALLIWEKNSDPNHPDVAWGLVNLGDLLLLARRPREALPLLERAVHIMNAHDGVQPLEFAAHFALARAIVAVGGETSRALAEARRARDGYRESGEVERRREVERWLARHGERR